MCNNSQYHISTYKHNEAAKKNIMYWTGEEFTPNLKSHKNRKQEPKRQF